MSLESSFDIAFTARLALKEKQIQQNYRPLIGIHKWFARRPGSVFRNLLLAEFDSGPRIDEAYFHSHSFRGVIADPFVGGGTTAFEANRLGFSLVAADVNPMAYWLVKEGLTPIDLTAFRQVAREVIAEVETRVSDLYATSCLDCGKVAPVKYFLWVKTQNCPACGTDNDLFPGYLLAEDSRHPQNVVACSDCGHLNEFAAIPTADAPGKCDACSVDLSVEGPARRSKISCRACGVVFGYPNKPALQPPRHRMWAIEYRCVDCAPSHEGRFFKRPDAADNDRYSAASSLLADLRTSLPIPDDCVPDGDETKRLHRWGYRRFAEMFNDRQLLGLGLLHRQILSIQDARCRHALLTVFSDFLRYQNMLCRYDTYALKCQDVFAIHGFPVGLVQCENNLLGIAGIGSGSYRHFIEKYARAKEYCLRPFESLQENGKRVTKYIDGERVSATIVDRFPSDDGREALLVAASATSIALPQASLDGVFTDPPYFDAIQYGELMDFCYAWLRIGLSPDVGAFQRSNSRHSDELTGNDTLCRDLLHFAEGLSRVFQHYAAALKPAAPFVFTYHHNDPAAYAPVVLAILDAGLNCTATLATPAEMGASLHIAGTGSSVLDTVFVCRASGRVDRPLSIEEGLAIDIAGLVDADIRVTEGDVRCLTSGHIARTAVNELHDSWRVDLPVAERLIAVQRHIALLSDAVANPTMVGAS